MLLSFLEHLMVAIQTNSDIRCDYSTECERLVNRQINLELKAWYQYMQMATYFKQHDVALPNLAKYFEEESDGEKQHADEFIKFQLTRGAKVLYEDLNLDRKEPWNSAVDVMEYHLKMEQDLFVCIKELAAQAEKNHDNHLLDMLDWFFKHQNDEIYEISQKLTNIKRVGQGLGLYLFDKFEIKD
ncbi:hypothetical protein ACOME3_000459 [Neoechinorhynchus agilis]